MYSQTSKRQLDVVHRLIQETESQVLTWVPVQSDVGVIASTYLTQRGEYYLAIQDTGRSQHPTLMMGYQGNPTGILFDEGIPALRELLATIETRLGVDAKVLEFFDEVLGTT